MPTPAPKVYKTGDYVTLPGGDVMVVAHALSQTSGYLLVCHQRAPRSHRQVGDYVPKDL